MRALRVLRDDVSLIACEDTRQTQKLLTHYEIHKPLVSYHEHNEISRSSELLAILQRGDSIALMSDAGTPLISDPGYRIVHTAIENGVRVVPIPGPSALLTALAGSGSATDSFLFIGFLPAKSSARRRRIDEVATVDTTLVFYESPHRVLETLADLAEMVGKRRVVLARELTKVHEEFLRGTAAEVRGQLADRSSIKGEFTVIVERGTSPEQGEDLDAVQEVKRLEAEGATRMDAIKSVAKRLAVPKREVYRAVEERGSSHGDKNHG
jgi:16S rRNA (cytidine1402-2'-O)-methyltransferase